MKRETLAYVRRAIWTHKPSPKSATNSHPHHSSPGPTILKAMHYLTAVQPLMPERRRRPARCHCASRLCSSKDSTWAEETCFLGSRCKNGACMRMSLCTACMCPGPLRMLALVALLILAQITHHSAPPRPDLHMLVWAHHKHMHTSI